MLTLGIDSGSTTTKGALFDGTQVVRTAILPTSANPRESILALYHQLHSPEVTFTVSTGYGRDLLEEADQKVTEITCHARGAAYLNPATRVVVDIGGQDSKVILLDNGLNVVDFLMNDKCAAGTGRFIEVMMRILEEDLASIDEFVVGKHPVNISSMCTVFAESEVVSLIADNHSAADIVHGLNQSVAAKTAALASRAGAKGPYMMTGGVARNRGVTEALEARLGAPLWLPPEPDLCGALGAALFALDSIQ